MPSPDSIPPGWFFLAAALQLLSLLALVRLRQLAGPNWLRWDRVPCPPWQLSDISGLGFLTAAAVFLFYPLTPAVSALGAVWLAQCRGFEITPIWRLEKTQIKIFESLFLYLACLLPISLLTAGSILLSNFFGVEDSMQGPVRDILESPEIGRVMFNLAAAVLIAPIWEEIVFRGVLYPFCKARMGRWPALVFTGVLFGSIHGHLPSLLPLILLGIILGLAYERSGSLWSPILLHAFFNLGTSINLLLLRLYDQP